MVPPALEGRIEDQLVVGRIVGLSIGLRIDSTLTVLIQHLATLVVSSD